MRLYHLVVLSALSLQAAEIPTAEPLFQAIRRADTGAVKRLLDSGISADSVDSDGVPAVMAATLFAGADCVKLLLDHNANPNATAGGDATALMWAMPDILQKFSVLYYVQSLCPVPPPIDPNAPALIRLLMSPAEPPSAAAAVLGLLGVTTLVLWAASRAVRRLEINYGVD